MENLSVSEIFDNTFHFFSHDSSYAIPGFHDLDILDASWVLSTTLIFFTMQTGLAVLEAGIISNKNKVNVMMRHMVDICAGGVSFWIFGFALMYGRGEFTNPFFGLGDFFVNTKSTDPLSMQLFTMYFFQMSFQMTATSIVSGACSERFRFIAYIPFSFLMTIVYAVGAGWVWGQHGWLRSIGVLDFAGTGPIHIIGGASSFAAAWFIGPRIGRYDKGNGPLPIGDPMNVCVGLFILWWGWIGFNAGSSYGLMNGKWEMAARAGASTTLCSMSSGFTAILFSVSKHKGKVDVFEVVSGVLSGLVAINAGCYCFSMISSVLVGIVAALLCLIAGPIIDNLRVDDAVGATPVHLVSGIWGQIAVGFFADVLNGPKGLFLGGGIYQLVVQTISAISLTLWAMSATTIIIWGVNKVVLIRMDPEDEKAGCDMTQHYWGESNSTDMQKSMSTLGKIITITTPIAQRLAGSSEERNRRDANNFDRRKPFYRNNAFEQHEERI